jgi:hypothetical protein
MNFVNCFDSVQMIDTRVEADLVHDDDPCFLCLRVELPHSGRNVAGSHNMSFALDCRLDNGCVVRVWNEGNDEVVGSDLNIELSTRVDIE